jgi:hypothetical protein
MICAIHQPQYLPYLGFFEKIRQADIFVFLDDCQFKKNEWQNRNRIKTKDGWQWITVPVIQRFGQNINEVKINNNIEWKHKHLQALITNYIKAHHFNGPIELFFKESYAKEWEFLADINMHFITYLKKTFKLNNKTLKSSELNIKSRSTQRLIDICKEVGADTYLSGPGGKDYLDIQNFEKSGINLIFQNFVHPEYKQQFNEFIPFLSSIDFLFNCGGNL